MIILLGYIIPLIICLVFTFGLHIIKDNTNFNGGPITNWELVQIWLYTLLPILNAVVMSVIIVAAVVTFKEHYDKNEKQEAK